MSLRHTAAIDCGLILEDTLGFAYDICITDPSGTSAKLLGFSNDVSEIIDPDTGEAVSGRTATIAIRIELLSCKGMGIPENVSEADKKPWVVVFDDINGNPFTFKVFDSKPDRSLGLVVCHLESYNGNG